MIYMFKRKNIFERINNFLQKKGHEFVMSIFLDDYNGNEIYIRLDYVPKLEVYKIVWFDLHFIDEKKLEDYLNIQTMTKYLATKIIKIMLETDYESGYFENENFIGDRVEIISNFKPDTYEFIFQRFLPQEWSFLIDVLVIIFTYLPRGMEVILNEMFAKFDGTEEKYNILKPIKCNINENFDSIFRNNIIERGKKYYQEDKVSFLEKINGKYLAIVEGKEPYLVVISEINAEYTLLLCNCKCDYYCKHIYAVLLAIKNKKFNNFYKVKYNGKEESLLDKVLNGSFCLCFGLEGDNLLLVTNDFNIISVPLIDKGKIMFEVIEDDDECSLSKFIENYKI